jgi:cytochrome oxidase Cu insertion factor (SCO1/SenC/PrrC family)
MLAIVVIVALVVLALVVVVAVSRGRRQPDAVDTFRRQIDALSPEARRNVVDQVQRIEKDEDTDDGT